MEIESASQDFNPSSMGPHEIRVARKIVSEFHPLQVVRIEDIFKFLRPFVKPFRKTEAYYHMENPYKTMLDEGGDNLNQKSAGIRNEPTTNVVQNNDQLISAPERFSKSIKKKIQKSTNRNHAMLRAVGNFSEQPPPGQFNQAQDNQASSPRDEGDFIGDVDFFLSQDEDPINRLGFGMVSYFNTVRNFGILFLFLSLLSYPMVLQKLSDSANTALTSVQDHGKYMLGNIPAADNKCILAYSAVEQLHLDCGSHGEISAITNFGIYKDDSEADKADSCSNANGFDTGMPGCQYLTNTNSSVFKSVVQPCIGQKFCKLNLKQYLRFGKQTNHPECDIQKDANVYIQFKCQSSPEVMENKRQIQLNSSCLSIFVACTLLSVIHYNLQNLNCNKKLYDLETVTASDYAMIMELTDDQMRKFISKDALNEQDPTGLRMKKRLTAYFEQQMRLDFPQINESSLKVADLSFAWRHGQTYKDLKKRQQAIMKKQTQKQKDIEKKLVREAEEHYGEDSTFLVPRKVIVTLETETAFNLLSKQGYIILNDDKVKIKEAYEPSNILWENVHSQQRTRFLWIIIAIILLTLFLVCDMIFDFWLVQQNTIRAAKYNTDIDCNLLIETYQTNDSSGNSYVSAMAVEQWHKFYTAPYTSRTSTAKHDQFEEKTINPVLSCFCEAKYVEEGIAVQSETWPDSNGAQVAVCAEWFYDLVEAKGVGKGIGLIIQTINVLLKYLSIAIIKNIQFHTATQEDSVIMATVYVTQLFNTGFLILLMNANFSEFDSEIIKSLFFGGKLTDFGTVWYKNVGKIIVSTMKYGAIMPPAEVFIMWGMKAILRWRDRYWTSDPMRTKQQGIQAYIDLYNGPDYQTHLRFSTVMVTISMTMLYGAALPELYPLCALTLLIIWAQGRMTICWFYMEPPSFDERMTKMALEIIRWITVVGLAFAFWQLGNRQFFENVSYELMTENQVRLSGHTIKQALGHLTIRSGNLGCFCMCITLSFVLFFRTCFTGINKYDVSLDEGLADFYDAMPNDERANLLQTELYYRQVYGCASLTEEQQSKLENAREAHRDKWIQAIPSYKITSNLKYCKDLYFYPPGDESVKEK